MNSGRFGFGSRVFGLDQFGFGSVRVISGSGRIGSIRVISGWGLYRINKISDRLGFGLGHFGFRVKSIQHDFRSVWFWVGSILVSGQNRFRSFGCRFGFGFGSFSSGQFCQV